MSTDTEFSRPFSQRKLRTRSGLNWRALFTSIFLLCLLVRLCSSQAETIEWSGYRWDVRDSGEKHQGPGPNLFSSSRENVFVDKDGRLHLRIVLDENGQWSCAEVSSIQSLGYGTYQWQLASNYDKLAKNVVLGLFTYNSPQRVAKQLGTKVGDGKPDTAHEIDIEFTRVWGDANLFFTTHDPDIQSPSFNFYEKLNGDYTTHRFQWQPERIHWESFQGHVGDDSPNEKRIVERREGERQGQPAQQIYQGPVIPKDLDQKVHINLWLFDQDSLAKKPADGKTQEVILEKFKFTPYQGQSTDKPTPSK